jgi:hypothetical protein
MARKRKADQQVEADDVVEDAVGAAADAEAPARNTNRREEQAALARRYAILYARCISRSHLLLSILDI